MQADLIYLFTLQTAQTIHNRVSAEHSGSSPTFISVLMPFMIKSLPLLSFYLITKGMPIPYTVYDPSLTNNLLRNRKNNFYNLENHFFFHLSHQLPSTLGTHFSSFIICNFTSSFSSFAESNKILRQFQPTTRIFWEILCFYFKMICLLITGTFEGQNSQN